MVLLPSNDDPSKARMLIEAALAAGQEALDEAQAKSLLGDYGVPVPAGRVATSETDARGAAHEIGFPVVMKAVGSAFQHKTEEGLVLLNVRDDAALANAFAQLKERAGSRFQGVLVERMVAAERELMVGMKRDQAYGPVVAFGVGGVFAEAIADIAVAVAPLDDRDAAELADMIRAKRMLGAFRNLPPVDQRALTDIIKAVGQIALDHPEIAEIDINPLLTENGQPVAADALVILRPEVVDAATASSRSSGYVFADMRPVFLPKAVAVVGASTDAAKWGGSILKNMIDGGYRGTIYPVNPRGGDFFGRQGYASVADLPSTPDLALVAVTAPQVEGVIDQCAERGVPSCVVITAGFSEASAEGKAMEQRVIRIAEGARMTLVGPNCMGLISNEARLHATGYVSLHPDPGCLSVISQSGTIGYKIVKMAKTRGAGIAKFIGVGNEASVTAVDVLEYLRTDWHTDVILIYLEGVEYGRELMELARRTTLNKPIVFVRGGMTESGSQAAASHTGAMASTATVREAAARQTGSLGVTSPEEGLDLALALAYLPLPPGPRVAVITLGGGWGVLAADDLSRNGLVLAELPNDLITALDKILPPFWSRRNPIDLVASGDEQSAAQVLDLVAGSDAVDALLVMALVGSPVASRDAALRGIAPNAEGLYAWDAAFMRQVASLLASRQKPIVVIPQDPLERSVFSGEGRYSPIVLATPRQGAQVLGQLARYSAYRSARTR